MKEKKIKNNLEEQKVNDFMQRTQNCKILKSTCQKVLKSINKQLLVELYERYDFFKGFVHFYQ